MSQPDPPRGNVFVIYQGKRSKNAIQHIRNLLDTNDCRPILLENQDESFGKDLLSRLRQDYHKCDAAIAVITPDGRRASEHGNLWFELGLWLGMKPRDTLLVCRQVVSQNGKGQEIFTTDGSGGWIHQFRELHELDGAIQRFLQKRVRLRPTTVSEEVSQYFDGEYRYKDTLRVQDTLTAHDSLIDEESLSKCVMNGMDCQTRRESLCLIGELLRMGKCSREYYVVIQSFGRIAFHCTELLETIDQLHKQENNHKMLAYNCQSRMDDIAKEIEFLRNRLNNLFTRNHHFKGRLDDGWNRLKSFLTYRLGCCPILEENFDNLENSDLMRTAGRLAQQVPEFVNWLSTYEEHYKHYKTTLAYERLEKATKHEYEPFVFQIYENKKFCEKALSVLRTLSDTYAEMCQEAIKANTQNVHDLQEVHIAMSEIRKTLPHNVDGNGFPCVWPRHETRQRAKVKV